MTTTKTHIEKYPAYKDSGVEWMSEIPEGWEVNRLKSKIFLLTGYPFKSDKYANIGIKLARGINVKEGYFDWSDKRCWPEVSKELEPFLLKEGDVLIAMDGSKVGKNFCQVKEDDLPVLLLQRVARLRTKNGLLPNFLYWNIVSKSFLSWVNISKTDPMVPHIAPKDINNFIIAIPSPSEQTAIANFLDDKTAKIDKAIAQKEKMISLLNERKQIIIQNAVTGKWSMINGQWSMTPKEKLKDSGVEWIGKIPEGWEVKNLRYAFKFLNHRRIPLSAVERESKQGEYPYYGASGIIDYVDDFIFNEKTILIAEDGANLLSKSTPLAFVVEGKYWVNNHAHILQPKFEGFLYWAELLSLIDYTVYISGAAQPKLSRENLGAVKIIVPPIEEIMEIVSLFRSLTYKFSKAINLQQTQIEKLKEYKATMIDSAVTGKIKVS